IWIAKNDPSPEGWRVPAREEIFSLFYSENVTNEWVTQNGVRGMLCTDINSGNSLFLPSAPCRSSSNGVLLDGYEDGSYWANDVTTYFDEYKAYGILIGDNGEKEWNSTNPGFAKSVRSVAENQDVVPQTRIITEDKK
ncbi:MAG: hypothetical protein LBR75_04385, partial [Prevotellaceae bacterium]|nr:hypothetical protein [Prevotellaceae bacterium]